MVRQYYGSYTDYESQFYLEADSYPNLPAWPETVGFVRANGPFPLTSPPNQHGGYLVDQSGNWYWFQTLLTYKLPVTLEYNEANGNKVCTYADDWGVRQVLSPSQLGAPSVAEMVAAISAQANKTARGKVTTDSLGNWTYSYASKNYSDIPVVSTDVQGAGGFVVNITSVTATSVSGNVVKPKAAVLGLLPYESAGVGTIVHVIASPAS